MAIKTWWGQDYVVGEIYPADWNRVNVSAKIWLGPAPNSLYAPAPLQSRGGGVKTLCTGLTVKNGDLLFSKSANF